MQIASGKVRYTASGVRFLVDSKALVQDQSPIAAYGFYRVNNAYTGNSCRVRRSSDNTESDIGFNADGTLNETALTTFCGADDGFVTTWYDQIGSRNATQATAANQPQIVSSGAVIKINGSPAVARYDGSNDRIGASLPNNATYVVAIGSWSALQTYEMRTQSSGVTYFPAGAGTSAYFQMPNANSVAYYPSPPASTLIASLRAVCQPDYTSDDVLRFQFGTAGAKSLTVTQSGSGITFTDSTGTQSTSYSRTVAAFDWLTVRATTPSGITQINWTSKNLVGGISQSMFSKLTGLTYFSVSSNQITGAIPNLSASPSLATFLCLSNQMTGTIPNLSANTALTNFQFPNNWIQGSVPSLTANTLLQTFNCNSNLLSGPLPSLSTNTALVNFYCHFNQLTGSIPDLTNNTLLQIFYCYSNQLTGSIPSLTTNTALVGFNCGVNQLTGSIPSLTTNTALTSFQCYTNQLTGSIPSFTANTSLITFHCYSNQLTDFAGGSVSATFGDFQAHNNLLSASAVNAILAAFVAAGRNSGTRILNLGGTGNAAPTGQGLTDKATLVSRGWTVTTN